MEPCRIVRSNEQPSISSSVARSSPRQHLRIRPAVTLQRKSLPNLYPRDSPRSTTSTSPANSHPVDHIFTTDSSQSLGHSEHTSTPSGAVPRGRSGAAFSFSEDRIIDYTVSVMFKEHVDPTEHFSSIRETHERRFGSVGPPSVPKTTKGKLLIFISNSGRQLGISRQVSTPTQLYPE